MKKIVTIAILVLVIVIAVTAYLNQNQVKEKASMIENATISIKVDGEEVGIMNLGSIQDLGEETFHANLKSSGKDPIEYQYTGVPLKTIFQAQEVDIEGNGQVIVRSVDGYTVALSVEEVLQEDNVYLAYERNGEPLGTKEDGGSGPYQIIIRNDPFSQRWTKFVVEVELQ
ncbi:molybdopterin-dependent oxidoreductase [Natronincola ferrireducens]|uniref:Oxidoreductase molybdopterin binding domain-containing protein n=1 Tax=Natronincola ferrireducens TaxID=393762 RepID=A0A1G8ZPM8_9FIRM|nr:molybdopterin-dependent oxidoreductase [Natronincola ferrireducens]SDK16534.1 Oxidoreductase molybdopterin binding domain-containing protein [Natronincola ferrireducens]